MERRKVIFSYEEYIQLTNENKVIGGKYKKHCNEKGWFLQFGIDTPDENCPCSCALIEDQYGKVYSCHLNDFKFSEWEEK